MKNLKFKDFKLSEYEQNYLMSVAVPRYVRETGKTAVQIWFEVFAEELQRLGYTVTKQEVIKSESVTKQVDDKSKGDV